MRLIEKNDYENLVEDLLNDSYMEDDSDDIYLEQNKLENKKGVPSYTLVYGNKLKDDEKPLEKVVGHENQKKNYYQLLIGSIILKSLKKKAFQFLKA